MPVRQQEFQQHLHDVNLVEVVIVLVAAGFLLLVLAVRLRGDHDAQRLHRDVGIHQHVEQKQAYLLCDVAIAAERARCEQGARDCATLQESTWLRFTLAAVCARQRTAAACVGAWPGCGRRAWLTKGLTASAFVSNSQCSAFRCSSV